MDDQQYEKECERLEAGLRPELTPLFLATMVKAARTAPWTAGSDDARHFIEWCFDVAGKECPDDEDMKSFTSP